MRICQFIHAACLLFAAAAVLGQDLTQDIGPQPLAEALERFAANTGLQLVYRTDIAAGLKTHGAKAGLSAKDALKQLLHETGLTFEFLNERAIAVVNPKDAPPSQGSGNSTPRRGAEGARDSRKERSSNPGQDLPDLEDRVTAIPEILVLGAKTLNIDIKRSRDDNQPYVVFSGDEIRKSGADTVEQFLRTRLTSMAVTPTQSQGPNNGALSSFSLRGLSSEQTLILVDGRRTASIADTGQLRQADINSIPTSAIERIDVLAATAAGIYGGGATGGVINVILKRDYRGLETTLTHEGTVSGGGGGNRVDLTGGFALENGRTNVMLIGSFSDRQDLLVSDRDLVQRARQHVLEVNPDAIFQSPTPPLGSTTNIRTVGGENLILKSGGTATSAFTSVPVGYGGTATDNGAALITTAGNYNLAFANTAQPAGGYRQFLVNSPTIKSLSATVRRDFSSEVQAFLEVGGSSNSGSFKTNNLSGTFFLPASASNNPFDQDVVVTTPTFGGDAFTEVTVDTSKAVGGVIMALPAQWQGSADFTWHRVKYFSKLPNDSLLLNSADAIENGALNLFRDTNQSPVDFSPYRLGPLSAGPSYSKLTSAMARAAGPLLLALPGGPVRLAAALEHRRERLDQTTTTVPLSLDFSNDVTDFDSIIYGRSRRVSSAYMEFNLPVVGEQNGLAWMRKLDVQVTGRWDRYETNGSNSTNTFNPQPFVGTHNTLSSVDPMVALRWHITPSLAMRASAGTGFQPPTLANLSPGTSRILSPAELALLGLVDPLRNEPVGATGRPVQLLSGGNPDLKPEDSKSASMGVIVTPAALPGLRVSLDWTRIAKTNNVGVLLPNNSNLALEPHVPGLVQRAEPLNDGHDVGPIIAYSIRALNFAEQTVAAYDLSAEYQTDDGPLGQFVFAANTTRNTENEFKFVPLQPATDFLGVTANAKWRGNISVTWTRGPWAAGWTARYADSYWVNSDRSVDPNQGSARIGSELLHDAQVSYTVDRMAGRFSLLSNSEVRLGLRNVFDRRPSIDVTNTFAPYSQTGDPQRGVYWVSFKKAFGE